MIENLGGIEKGVSLKEQDFTLRLWEAQLFSIGKIASLVGVTEEQVVETLLAELQKSGQTLEEAQNTVKAYREKHPEETHCS